jgi:hypothetical protein
LYQKGLGGQQKKISEEIFEEMTPHPICHYVPEMCSDTSA